jgi:DNA-binding transcriptional LysR family regulator
LIAPFDLAIAPQGNSPHFKSRLREIELLAVARAGHSLFSRAAPLSSHTLARHRRVDIHHSTELTNNNDAENKNRVWQVSTIESAIAAVLQGLCYGWLPRDLIADHLAEGRLIPLDLAQGGRRQIPLDLFYADEERDGSGTKDLASLLFNATRGR